MNWSTLGKIIKINENKHNYYKFSMSRTIVNLFFLYNLCYVLLEYLNYALYNFNL